MSKRPKIVFVKSTVADAISTAFGELTSLGEEMREAFDNTPESLQGGDVGQRREAAADALEGMSEPSLSDKLGALEMEMPQFTYTGRRGPSRPARRDDAVQILDTVIQFLDEEMEKHEEEKKDEAEEEQRLELVSEIEGLRDEVDNLKAEAEDVDFPGMFG